MVHSYVTLPEGKLNNIKYMSHIIPAKPKNPEIQRFFKCSFLLLVLEFLRLLNLV